MVAPADAVSHDCYLNIGPHAEAIRKLHGNRDSQAAFDGIVFDVAGAGRELHKRQKSYG